MMDKSERAEKKEARRMVNRRKYAIETAKDVCNANAGFTPEQILDLGIMLDGFIATPKQFIERTVPHTQSDQYKAEVIHVPPTSTGSTGTSPISTGNTSSIPPPTNQYPAR